LYLVGRKIISVTEYTLGFICAKNY